jgi:hypothetical protein
MLGMLTILLSALLFAQERKEDGHLPERNGRGPGEMISPALSGPGGITITESRVVGSRVVPHSWQPVSLVPCGMR